MVVMSVEMGVCDGIGKTQTVRRGLRFVRSASGYAKNA